MSSLAHCSASCSHMVLSDLVMKIKTAKRATMVVNLHVCWNVFLCRLASSSGPSEQKTKDKLKSGSKELKSEV